MKATVDRRELLAALADARHENELLRTEYGNRLIRSRQRRAAYVARQAAREERQFAEALKEAFAQVRPDPNAASHRTTLEHALRKAHA